MRKGLIPKSETISLLVVLFLMLMSLPLISDASDSGSYYGKSKLGFGFRADEPGKLIADKDYAKGELIVAYYEVKDLPAIESIVANFGGKKIKSIIGASLFRFSSDEAMLKAVDALIKDSRVRLVERNGIMTFSPKTQLNLQEETSQKIIQNSSQIQAVSNDPGTSFQYHLTLIRKTVANTTSTNPPIVAVLSTGVDHTHPDLQGNVILGKNCVEEDGDLFDNNGSGTYLTGIISAKAGNRMYGEGVCPNCKVLAIKVCENYLCSHFDIICGLQYARTSQANPKVILIEPYYFSGSLFNEEINQIKEAGKISVVPAGDGNYPELYSSNNQFPHLSINPNVAFRVMATDQNDCRYSYSNFSHPSNSTTFNIAAPGWMIPSTLPEAQYGTMYSSTRAAAAVVAGATALIWGELPNLSRDQLIERILNNSQPTTCGFPGYTVKRIDIQRALTQQTESRTVLGRLIDPFTGKPPALPLATARVFSGTTELGKDIISRDGFYEINITGNVTTNLLLRGTKTGFVTANLRRFNLGSNRITGPFTDAFPRVRANHATIILDWKTIQPLNVSNQEICSGNCLGWEFNLSLKTPEQIIIGPYPYFNGSLKYPPYVFHPRDSRWDYEPLETIIISPEAVDGDYKVFVALVSNQSQGNPNWTGSQASVQVFSGGNQLDIYHNPPSNCGTSPFWHVGNIKKEGTTYYWTNVNLCLNEAP